MKRGNTREWLYKIIAAGIDGTPMPSFQIALKPDDIWAIVYYLETIVKERRGVFRRRRGMMMGMMGMMRGMFVGEEFEGMRIDMEAAHAWMMSRMHRRK